MCTEHLAYSRIIYHARWKPSQFVRFSLGEFDETSLLTACMPGGRMHSGIATFVQGKLAMKVVKNVPNAGPAGCIGRHLKGAFDEKVHLTFAASMGDPSQRTPAATPARKVKRSPQVRKHNVRSAPRIDPTRGDDRNGENLIIRRATVMALGWSNGSVVIVDPTTGRILTIVNQKLALKSGFTPCSTIKLIRRLPH